MKQQIQSRVYIDEAGDLGANRGTQWFVLTAVIVDTSDEPYIRQVMQNIKYKFNYQTIHWRKIKEFNKRAFIVSKLSSCSFTYINILFDTTKYDIQKIGSTEIAYNYLCKLLLERVSWFMNDTNRIGEIVLSSRGTSKDQDLIDYITKKLLPYNNNNIESHVFASVYAKSASSWDMLQLADVCATTIFNQHERDWLGFVTPCHSMKLKNKLFSRRGKILTYGVKYFSDDMMPQKSYFLTNRFCSTQT